MILARYGGHWYLAVRGSPSSQTCGLVGGDWDYLRRLGFERMETTVEDPQSGRRFHFVKLWKGGFPIQDVTFYPELRYRGALVVPEAWKSDAPEPMLKLRGSFAPSGLPPDADEEEFIRQRLAEGWVNAHDEGFWTYIHVDDPHLEKSAGPPPVGPF